MAPYETPCSVEFIHLNTKYVLEIVCSKYTNLWSSPCLPPLPRPEEEDSLSATEQLSAWSCDSPSIKGMESSDEGTDES